MGREEPVASVDRSRSTLRETYRSEWPLLKVQRSVTSQDNEWLVPAAAFIGRQNLTGRSQPNPDIGAYAASATHD